MDRQIYWRLRSLSQQIWQAGRIRDLSLEMSILTTMTDGMDQSKLRTPRFSYAQRWAKNMEKLFRPACHLTGTWLHGLRLFFRISDEDQKKDSQTQIENLMLALSALRQSVGQLPLHWHLQQDNCYREGKNQYVLSMMVLLVILGVFRVTSMGFLRTGHSHEDLDQCFGQLARLLRSKAFNSANELVEVIRRASEAPAASAQAEKAESRIGGGSRVTVCKLDEVSKWRDWVDQLGMSFKGLRIPALFTSMFTAHPFG